MFCVLLFFWRVDDSIALLVWNSKKLSGKSRGVSSVQGCFPKNNSFWVLLVFYVYMDALDNIVKNLALHLNSCCGIGDVKTIFYDSAFLNDAHNVF